MEKEKNTNDYSELDDMGHSQTAWGCKLGLANAVFTKHQRTRHYLQ